MWIFFNVTDDKYDKYDFYDRYDAENGKTYDAGRVQSGFGCKYKLSRIMDTQV